MRKDSNIKLMDIEEGVKKILNFLSKKLQKSSTWPSDRELTRIIIDRIGKFGLKNGYMVCPNYRSKYWSEWLYDLIWLEYDNEEFLKTIPLVLECEWSGRYDEIIDDFSKLWIARAKHRIMIFRKKSDEDIHSMIDKLLEGVSRFKGTENSDRYFFAGLNWNTGIFQYRLFTQRRD